MDNNWWIFEAQSKRNKEIRKTFTLNFSFTKIVGCRTIPQISCKFKSFLAFQQIINVLHIMCTNEPRSNWKQTLLKGPILLTHYNQFFISIRPKKNFNKMQNRDSTINSLDSTIDLISNKWAISVTWSAEKSNNANILNKTFLCNFISRHYHMEWVKHNLSEKIQITNGMENFCDFKERHNKHNKTYWK